MKNIIFAVTIFTFVLLGAKYPLAQGIKHDIGHGSFDLVEKKTMEIEAGYEYDKFDLNNTLNGVTLNSKIKYVMLPSLTISYGLSDKFEISCFSGITGLLTDNAVTFLLFNERTFTLNKNIIGIDASGFGMKYGIMSEQKLRPSLNLGGNFTMPFLGDPLFRPDNVGADLSLNLHNTFSDFFDLSYSIGNTWSGYNLDPYATQTYSLNPCLTFNDNLSADVDLSGYVSKKYSPWSKLTFEMEYIFSDYITSDLIGGASFYKSYKSYFLGLSGTFVIDFNKDKESKK